MTIDYRWIAVTRLIAQTKYPLATQLSNLSMVVDVLMVLGTTTNFKRMPVIFWYSV